MVQVAVLMYAQVLAVVEMTLSQENFAENLAYLYQVGVAPAAE